MLSAAQGAPISLFRATAATEEEAAATAAGAVEESKPQHDAEDTSAEDAFKVTPTMEPNTRKFVSINISTKQEVISPHIRTTEELYVLGLNLGKFSRSVQFIICLGGVFVFYLIYGYLQELIFSVEGFKPFGWYLTLVQFAYYSLFGLVELKMKSNKQRRIPLRTYFMIAFLTVATMGLSNTSLGYLNYPTQVIFKCCKLVPVMIGGVLIQGKRYTLVDVCAVICMSLGLIWFTLADSKVVPNFNVTGVALILLALCADAAIGNVQEKAMKEFSSSNSEMVLYSYSIGFVYLFFGIGLSGSFSTAFTFCYQHPFQTYGYALIFSISGYLGISFVLALIKLFGALVAVTVTTGRKTMTIVLSFMFFSKPFTIHYVFAGAVVVLGIFLNFYSKNSDKINCAMFYNLWTFLTKKRTSFSHTV